MLEGSASHNYSETPHRLDGCPWNKQPQLKDEEIGSEIVMLMIASTC